MFVMFAYNLLSIPTCNDLEEGYIILPQEVSLVSQTVELPEGIKFHLSTDNIIVCLTN